LPAPQSDSLTALIFGNWRGVSPLQSPKTKQEKEIKTIKNRSITIKLSDADCERISKKAGLGG